VSEAVKYVAIIIVASLSEPHIEEFAVEFVYYYLCAFMCIADAIAMEFCLSLCIVWLSTL